MKQKLLVCGLSLTLLLAQNVFVFSQTTGDVTRSNDAVINLFDDPDLIAVAHVKKILSETAPAILSGHPETIEKIRTAMKQIENDMGIDPYAVEKIVFGMKLGGSAENEMIALQTVEPASAVAEKMYQMQLVNAKFAPEINPLKNRIDLLERQFKTIKGAIIPENQPNEQDAEMLENFQMSLAKVKPLKTELTAFNKIKSDTAKLSEQFKNYQNLQKSVYDLGDLETRLTAVKAQTDKIYATDPQHAAKIAAADKMLVPVEQEFSKKRARMLATDEARVISGFSNDGFPEVPDDFDKLTPLARKDVFQKMQSLLNERIESLSSITDVMTAENPPPDTRLKEIDESDLQNPANPIAVEVSRKDETVGGKKLSVITTVKKYPQGSIFDSKPSENSVLVYDDKTLLIGDRETVVRSLVTKTANANQTAKNLVARSPDALVSFGANFRNIDMTEFAGIVGEQKFAWQMVGSLDSTGNDFSVTMAFEKTDIPYVFQGKKADAQTLKAPEVPGGDEVKELVESMFKSMIGVEAKVTIRFDKQKTAGVFEKTPNILKTLLKR